MGALARRKSGAVAKGSVGDVARKGNQSIARAIYNGVKAVVLFDNSDSMAIRLPNGRRRWDKAVDELEALQSKYEGAIALVQFNTTARFVPNGIPDGPSGMTYLDVALRDFGMPVDAANAVGNDILVIVISDGEPTDPDQAMRIATGFSHTKVHTIFCGRDGTDGQKFMEDLAAATGGQHQCSPDFSVEKPIAGLLTDGGE